MLSPRPGTDQFGTKLTGQLNQYLSSAVWPPLGYNLIMQMSRDAGEEARAAWPPGCAPASTGAAVPAQLTMPAGGGGAHCGECGKALDGSKFCKGCGAPATA